jgi:hypothetical protein
LRLPLQYYIGNGGCGGGLRGQRLDADEQSQKTKDDLELFLPKIKPKISLRAM